MTINKEQTVSDAVSDAMIEAGFNAAGSRRYWLDEDSLSAIYLAMKAASHPLEQQQAKEGTLAEQLREHSRRLSYAEDTHHDDVVSMCKEARPYIDKAADALDQQAVSGDVVERLVREFEKIQGYKGDEHRTMARAALTASGVGTWQPIETAPDGDILLWDGHEIDVGYAAWEQGGKPVYFNGDVRVDATHWMPLPEPPRTALQEEGVERRD